MATKADTATATLPQVGGKHLKSTVEDKVNEQYDSDASMVCCYLAPSAGMLACATAAVITCFLAHSLPFDKCGTTKVRSLCTGVLSLCDGRARCATT